MSREEADIYIRQLRKELQDRELRNIGGAQNLDYENYGIEEARTAKNEQDARTKEFKELNNFLYGLSDVNGFLFESTPYTSDSLRAEALQVYYRNGASEEARLELKEKIKDFVRYAVISKSIKFTGLMSMADRSDSAGDLIDELLEDKDFAQACMKLQRTQY
jgi:hypothetical protein